MTERKEECWGLKEEKMKNKYKTKKLSRNTVQWFMKTGVQCVLCHVLS